MAPPYMRVLHGTFVVQGYAPDGDSLQFVADDPRLYRFLDRAHLVRAATDGSVQIRLEGIDAPELRYQGHHQPLAENARDALLEAIGFEQLDFTAGYVLHGERTSVRGAIVTSSADSQGRPIAYALREEIASRVTKKGWCRIDRALLSESVNAHMLAEGHAYPLTYTTMPIEHRTVMRGLAASARRRRRGVWALDRSDGFELNACSRGLLLPKLFRKCVQYLEIGKQATAGGFRRWLAMSSGEDDDILVDGRRMRLSSALSEHGERLRFSIDPVRVVFCR